MRAKIFVAVLAVLVLGVMVLPLAQERARRERFRSEIKASYLRRASRGEVAVPANNSDALRCFSRSSISLPIFVEVKTGSGNTLIYVAHRRTNSDAPYSFEFE